MHAQAAGQGTEDERRQSDGRRRERQRERRRAVGAALGRADDARHAQRPDQRQADPRQEQRHEDGHGTRRQPRGAEGHEAGDDRDPEQPFRGHPLGDPDAEDASDEEAAQDGAEAGCGGGRAQPGPLAEEVGAPQAEAELGADVGHPGGQRPPGAARQGSGLLARQDLAGSSVHRQLASAPQLDAGERHHGDQQPGAPPEDGRRREPDAQRCEQPHQGRQTRALGEGRRRSRPPDASR